MMTQSSGRRIGAQTHDDHRIVLALLRADISARIRPWWRTCQRRTVVALIDDIARIKDKYEGLGALRNTPAAGAERIREKDAP